jgi:hypothetical protein
MGIRGPTKLIFRNDNVKSLFDPSNTEVNTVEDNMDKWVNYRGEVLQPPISFMSAESVTQSGNFDLETCLLWIRVFYTIIWMLGISPSSEVIG